MRKYQTLLLLLPSVVILANCAGNQASLANQKTASNTTLVIPASSTTYTEPTSTTFPPCKDPNPPGHLCHKASSPVTRTTTVTVTPPAVDKLGAALEAMQIIIDERSVSNPSPEESAYFDEFNINCGQDTTSPTCISWLENNPPPLGGFAPSNTTTTMISSPCGWNISMSECMSIIKKHQSESSP